MFVISCCDANQGVPDLGAEAGQVLAAPHFRRERQHQPQKQIQRTRTVTDVWLLIKRLWHNQVRTTATSYDHVASGDVQVNNEAVFVSIVLGLRGGDRNEFPIQFGPHGGALKSTHELPAVG